MECSSPPPLTDDQITALLDGEAEPSVHDHLARCPACHARLAAAQRFEQVLRASLQRWDCPTPLQLGHYHLGLLDPEDERAIRQHLAHCHECTDELTDLRLMLGDSKPPQPQMPAQPPRAGLSLGALLAQWLPRAPALAMRGAGLERLEARAGDISVVLEVQPAAAGQVLVVGQVVTEELDRWVGALVEVRQAGSIQATAVVDALGWFSCGSLSPEPTEFRITPQRGRMLVLPELSLQRQAC